MMKTTKNTKRILVFNLIATIISRSSALDCYEKAVFTKQGGDEQTKYGRTVEEGEESRDCSNEATTHCATVSGPIKAIMGGEEYEIKSVQSCRTSQQYWKYCGSQDPLTEFDFKMVLSIGFGLDFDLDNSEGSTEIKYECCQEKNCNKIETPTTTTEAASCCSVIKMNFIYIPMILTLAVFVSFFA